jgi:hypothetical protein
MSHWNEPVFMRNISYRCGGMNCIAYPIGTGERTCACWNLRCFHSDLLSDVVEAIWDCDIPDGDLAKALTIKWDPGTFLRLMG